MYTLNDLLVYHCRNTLFSSFQRVAAFNTGDKTTISIILHITFVNFEAFVEKMQSTVNRFINAFVRTFFRGISVRQHRVNIRLKAFNYFHISKNKQNIKNVQDKLYPEI